MPLVERIQFSIQPAAAARAFADADSLFYIIEECATQMFGSTFYQCVWMRSINLNFSYRQHMMEFKKIQQIILLLKFNNL
jgi:hypothetical protein